MPCGPGTFNNGTRAVSSAACVPCSPGFFCPSSATVSPTLPCPATYYCAGGNVNGTETPCPPGRFCAGAVAAGSPCAAGSYADVAGLAACKTCPSRFFCAGTGVVSPAVCPAGYWCGANASSGVATPCGLGTFSNSTGLATTSECAPCSPGAYCGTVGLAAPTASCAAGYYCIQGASSPTPAAANNRCENSIHSPGDATARRLRAITSPASAPLMPQLRCHRRHLPRRKLLCCRRRVPDAVPARHLLQRHGHRQRVLLHAVPGRVDVQH